MLGLILFNIFINAMEDGISGILMKSTEHTKLQSVININEKREIIPKALDRLEMPAGDKNMRSDG